MPSFTPEQKKIAMVLLEGPRSVDDLNKSTGIAYGELNEQLKKMLKVKLLKLEGYPQKYSLADSVVEGVKRRREVAEKDPFELKIKAVIEVKGVEETFVEKHLKELEQNLRKSRDFTVYDVYAAKPITDGGMFSAYLDVNLSIKDFTSIVRFMYYFGPTTIEVQKPQKITISMDDLQDAMMEMAGIVQSYNQAMLKSMNKDELDAFAQSLYRPAAD